MSIHFDRNFTISPSQYEPPRSTLEEARRLGCLNSAQIERLADAHIAQYKLHEQSFSERLQKIEALYNQIAQLRAALVQKREALDVKNIFERSRKLQECREMQRQLRWTQEKSIALPLFAGLFAAVSLFIYSMNK
ncbi:MAG: hypothetical protein HY861_00865 [Chlamydiia bacterium]|nr:hypothetical protein [Chlamydiia bacterium]